MIRAFVAIDLSSELKDKLATELRDLKKLVNESDYRWARAEGLHITLKFLGNFDEALVSNISERLREESRNQQPLKLSLSGFKTFGPPTAPRILFRDIEGDREQLSDLAARIGTKMESFGFEPEKRPFSPHLTLVRLRKGSGSGAVQGLKKLVAQEPSTDDDSFEVRSMVLMRSQLHPDGSIYTPMETFPFGGGNS